MNRAIASNGHIVAVVGKLDLESRAGLPRCSDERIQGIGVDGPIERVQFRQIDTFEVGLLNQASLSMRIAQFRTSFAIL